MLPGHRRRAVGVRGRRRRRASTRPSSSGSGWSRPESSKERPYIDRNIEATRAAIGLDDVEVEPVRSSTTTSTRGELEAERRHDAATSGCWTRRDRQPHVPAAAGDAAASTSSATSTSTATRSTARCTQVVLAARELNPGGLPRDVVGGPAPRLHPRLRRRRCRRQRAVTSDGRPGVPRQRRARLERRARPDIEQPAIYFGEDLRRLRHRRHRARRRSTTRTQTGRTRSSRTTASGGVEHRLALRRAAFALRFGDINPLISGLHHRRVADPLRPRRAGAGARRWRRSSSSTPTRTR